MTIPRADVEIFHRVDVSVLRTPTYFGLDLGVEAACIALASAGCVPGASCHGHPPGDHPWSNFPIIVFGADPQRASAIENIARACACGLASTPASTWTHAAT